MRNKPPSRDGRLQQLKAFGLFILGTHTLYQIAEKIGIAERNPSTAAGRARTKVAQGWAIIVDRKVARWDRYWSGNYPMNGWQTLSGARLWTHPRADVVPPKPPPTPFEALRGRIRLAVKWGVDSIDGTTFSKYGDLPSGVAWIDQAQRQRALWSA